MGIRGHPMTDLDAEPVQVAWELGRRAARLQETVTRRWDPGRPAGTEHSGIVLADMLRAWTPGLTTMPDLSQPLLWLPLDRGPGRFGPRRPPEAGIWFVTGTLPVRAAAQVLLVRPDEIVVALSRRAPADTIATAVRQLRDAVGGWARAGSAAARGGSPLAVRADYHLPRAAWQLTASGLIAAPPEEPPLVDTSTATVLTVPGPTLGAAVIEQWLPFLEAVPDAPRPHTVLAGRLAETWAWAAVDALVDSLGAVAARLEQDPAIGDRVYQRHLTGSAEWGYARESVLGPIRSRLLDRHAVLSGRPRQALWQRLGIRRGTVEEQDTLLMEPVRGHPLRVELVPAWFPDGDPPGRAHVTGDRTVIEVNVTADPGEIELEVWGCLERGLALPRDTRPAGPADLPRVPDPETGRAMLARLTGLSSRLEKAATFVDWLATVHS